MASYYDWSTDPAANATVGNVNWQEQQPPSSVNNSSRQEMAHAAAFRRDTTAIITSTGTNNNYAITIDSQITAYARGMTVVFKSHLRNDGAATLNLTPSGQSALGTQPLRAIDGQATSLGRLYCAVDGALAGSTGDVTHDRRPEWLRLVRRAP